MADSEGSVEGKVAPEPTTWLYRTGKTHRYVDIAACYGYGACILHSPPKKDIWLPVAESQQSSWWMSMNRRMGDRLPGN
jgi:hypothetical protein